jgi:hypothetical protein
VGDRETPSYGTDDNGEKDTGVCLLSVIAQQAKRRIIRTSDNDSDVSPFIG